MVPAPELRDLHACTAGLTCWVGAVAGTSLGGLGCLPFLACLFVVYEGCASQAKVGVSSESERASPLTLCPHSAWGHPIGDKSFRATSGNSLRPLPIPCEVCTRSPRMAA